MSSIGATTTGEAAEDRVVEVDHTRSNGVFIGAGLIGAVAVIVLAADQLFAAITAGAVTLVLAYAATRVRLDERADARKGTTKGRPVEPSWGDSPAAAPSDATVSHDAVPEPDLVVVADPPTPNEPGPVQVVSAAPAVERGAPRTAAPLPRRR